MHSYKARWPEKTDFDNLPDIGAARFNSTADLISWAEYDRLIGWKTWPEVWHLDDTGKIACYYKASSCDSIKRWADEPYGLYASRAAGLRDGGCPDRWLIVESRNLTDPPIVDEADAAAFVVVEALMAEMGIVLVDDVIFDDSRHWWSMRELTTGSLDWPTNVAEMLRSRGARYTGSGAPQRRQRSAATRRGRRAVAGDSERAPGG